MEFPITLCILIVSSVILICMWLRNRFNYWKERDLATPPYSYLWGNAKQLLMRNDSFSDTVLSYYRYFKPKGLKHGGIYLMSSPTYLPVDIEIIKHILQVDFQHFSDRGVYVNEKADPLSAHLFSLSGKKWKLLRSKLSPTFTSGKLKMMFETLVDCTTGLFKVMDKEEGHAVDIKDVLARFTTDIIGSCAFGLDCNSLENPENEFRKQGKTVFQRTFVENFKQFMAFAMPGLMKIFNVRITPPAGDFFMEVVKDTVEYREKNNIFRKDFMHLLIQLKNRGQLVDDEKLVAEEITEVENKITMNEIAANAFIFFGAGFETSSTMMTFCLYELAKNKNIQDKAREEIRKIFEKYGRELTYEAVMDMHYLEQIINETLRKYPPIPSLARQCTKPYKVPGTDLVLEKGVKLMIPIIGIQHDPEYYPEPQKFDPDRFSIENKQNRPAFTFLPFGEGPRNCIGERFGLMQARVGLVSLLLNYEFSVNERTKEPIEYETETFIMSTKGGMWLDVKKISPKTVQLLPKK